MPLRNSSKTKNQFNLQGTGASQLVQLIKSYGYNKDVDIELATITSAPPELKIRVDGMSIDLDAEDLIVAKSITNYSQAITPFTINSTTISSLQINNQLQVNDRVIVANISAGQLYIILDRAVTY